MDKIVKKKKFKKKYIIVSTIIIFLRQSISLLWHSEYEYVINLIFSNIYTIKIYIVLYLIIYESLFAPIYNLNELFKKRIDLNKFHLIIIILNLLILIYTLIIFFVGSYYLFYGLWKTD